MPQKYRKKIKKINPRRLGNPMLHYLISVAESRKFRYSIYTSWHLHVRCILLKYLTNEISDQTNKGKICNGLDVTKYILMSGESGQNSVKATTGLFARLTWWTRWSILFSVCLDFDLFRFCHVWSIANFNLLIVLTEGYLICSPKTLVVSKRLV